jgi:hypothetical protein
MQFRSLQLGLGLGALLLMAACVAAPAAAPSGGAAAAPAAKANTLTAVKVDGVSADAAAAQWANAPLLTLETKTPEKESKAGPAVSVQAVYDDTAVAFRFEWADATESLMKNAWAWDGSKFTKSGDEDRVQLLWPIQNIADFASKGCAAACHNMDADQEKWWMGTDSPDLRYDLWHWKSARTGPVGQSDDQWVSDLADPTNVESPRRGDAKESGGYKDNLNEAKDGPAVMHTTDPAAKFIMAGEEAPVDTAALASGAIIPGFIITPAVGSRGDLTANATWKDGKWTVVIMRALDTAHDDDVVFTPPKLYPFGMAVTDNNGGNNHTIVPDVVTLEWQ